MQKEKKNNLKRRLNKSAFKVYEKPERLMWISTVKKVKRKALPCFVEVAAGPEGEV